MNKFLEFLGFLNKISAKFFDDPEFYFEERMKRKTEQQNVSLSDLNSSSSKISDSTIDSNLGAEIFSDIPEAVECRLDLLGIKKKPYISSICFISNLLANAWHGRRGAIGDTDTLIDTLKNLHVFLSVPILLESFEKHGTSEIASFEGYKIISEIVLMCLTESTLKFNIQVPLRILEMSKKYYFTDNNTHSDLD